MMSKVSGYILAGGKSSRMGKDKGLLTFNNRTFVEEIAKQLQPVVESVIIVTNNVEYHAFGYEILPDAIKQKGPLGGLYTALKHSKTNHNIIVSCDTPFVNTKVFETLLQNPTNNDATLVSIQSEIQPLMGVYSQACFFKIQQSIELQQYKMYDFINQINFQTVEISHESWFSEKIGYNINTPSDYQKINNTWK